MKRQLRARGLCLGAFLCIALPDAASAAVIRVINDDGPGEGFNDPRAWAPRGGNPADYSLTGSKLVRTLHGAKARKLAEVKMKRDAVINGGCSTPKGRVQTDPDSRAALADAARRNVTVTWRMADNSTVAHSASEMKAADDLVFAHVQTARALANQLSDRIERAKTAKAISFTSR